MEHLQFWLITVFSERDKGILGNVSAVVKLEEEISAVQMQLIANDLNQPATTFIWKQDNKWLIRWFAPDAEIQLCGHGTMAAVALFDYLNKPIPEFEYAKGIVSGSVEGLLVFAKLNKGTFKKSEAPQGLETALGVNIVEHFETNDKNIVLVSTEEDVRGMQPNFDTLKMLKPFGYAVTAVSKEADFVSRTLVPKVQQLEDHATGSSHSVLVPFWAERLGKVEFSSKQLSRRGGSFKCILKYEDVYLGGNYKIIGSGRLSD